MDSLSLAFDELMAFVAVVDAGGYNAAAARFDIPASRLSRSVAALERQLGANLLVRTSRTFTVTEVGWRVHEHGTGIRAKLQDALAEVTQELGEPAGHLRICCPLALTTCVVGALAVRFMQRHPRVRLTLESTDGRSRPFAKPVDLAIQPSFQPLPDARHVALKLVEVPYVMVAAPGLRHGVPDSPAPSDFPVLQAIGWSFPEHPERWPLEHPDFGVHEVAVDARFVTDNLMVVRDAALAGMGIALLPAALCRADLQAGRLHAVAPPWSPPRMSIYAVYPSRHSLTLAGRKFVELLAAELAQYGRVVEGMTR